MLESQDALKRLSFGTFALTPVILVRATIDIFNYNVFFQQ